MKALGLTGTIQKSLTGGGSLYTVVQMRAATPGSIRVQWGNEEITFQVSTDLTSWLSKCQATRPSLAGTKAMYVPSLARRESAEDKTKVRFQVPGPKLNREWGSVFVAYCPTVWEGLAQ
jgi:hypothetical protein